MTVPAIRYPRHPAHLAPYVEVLGPALAVRFLIQFAGCDLYFPGDPKGKGAAEQLVGPERIKALGARLGNSKTHVPVPRTWLIHALRAEGAGTAEICRTLKITHRTVHNALKLSPNGASHPAEVDDDPALEPRQMRLF